MSRFSMSNAILDQQTFSACRPMLGQIAHDFNNLLTPLLAYPTLLKINIPDDASANMLDAIEKAARDMIHINEQILLLSSDSSTGRSECRAEQIIDTAIMKLYDDPKYGRTRPETAITARLPKVNVNVDLISHALFNVLINAMQAAPENRKVSISADRVNINAMHPLITEAPCAGDFVKIMVKDNGPGFQEDVLQNAAVPFVTTKKDRNQRGSGLGLSITYMVCKDHGGFLHLQNGSDGGAEVSILLPPALTDTEKQHAADLSPALLNDTPTALTRSCSKNRILLVDDESTILKLFKMLIASSIPDCTIDTASNGKEALDAFSANHHAVIVMDLHMPVMDGQTAFDEIHKLAGKRNWDSPAVVFCTGFAPPDMVNRIISKNSKHCLLSKPVRGEVLVEAIKSRLS